ncbi:YitT family protein [Vagococcus jeotgali]|uniref:YitT family protein n=1 Tax=Vagococcus jeotgali TaxID=3109030 RepID=UPI002DDA1B3B|nr:YitT family protein [Vagococcus sp. B2T-5]
MIQKLQHKLGKRVTDTIFITIGAFLVAFGFDVFLLPNKIVSGGVNGLTIILNEVFGLAPSLVLYSVNIVLLIFCYFFLGKEILAKSILGSLLVPTFVSLLKGVSIGEIDMILAAIFGGIVVGLGIGLVYLGNGSTGGTSLIALLIQKFIPAKLGVLLGFCDGLIIISALFVFNIQTVLFALISLYLTSKMIDTVQVGPDFSKNVFIISDNQDDIKEMIINDLNFGASIVPIEGGLKSENKKMIMTVIQEERYLDLKQAVLQIDPNAFMVITSANEVVGKGFSTARS